MNPEDHYFSILCKYFVYFGIRFQLDFSWIIRLVSVLFSCTFNLFRANRLLTLYLSVNKANYSIHIVQFLQLSLDIWLYFYLLFNQDLISDLLSYTIATLPSQSKARFQRKLKLYRIVYLIFLIEILRLSLLWYY